MRLTHVLTSLVLPLLTIAAKSKDANSTFDKYHKQALSSAPVNLDDSSFAQLTSASRDFGSVVCLTAIEPEYKCKICQDFAPEWNLLSKSWTSGDKKGDGRLVFGTLDIKSGRPTFVSLKLDTAPVILYYPPTTGPYAAASSTPVRYDFTMGSSTAEAVHAWLSRHRPDGTIKPPVRRPFNYVRAVVLVTGLLGGITAVTKLYPYLMPVLQNRNIWAGGSVVAILLFTSGHMYNHIRGVPYVGVDGRGGPVYFAGGFQNQFGMESQIVAGMYGVLAFATIYLTLKVPRMQEAKAQQVAVIIWVAVMYGMYSFLMSIFRVKNGGYPYGLPPF